MSSQLEKGRKVGQFEIVGILGKGGMASVYRAYQPNLEREVAIKVMADNYASDTTFVERFRREARSIARLRHPNILTVYDAGEDNGLLYIAMELIDGPTLKEEMHGRPLPVDKAIKYISQVASALDYANRMGIIHRDVKPTNVLIDQGERAVLSDFGIAKLAEQAAGNQLTSTGTGVGTPDYMSPEQALGEELDARSDQYSLGVMLYELLTGRTPYTGDTPIAVVMGHVSKPLPSARQLNPQIP
ncbi:MAG TPA: serine/threonine-protein kinase, partial [Chloroflexia bacterium]|nr:serine/threonine-protein kinase [Chloroflexia bacterium]